MNWSEKSTEIAVSLLKKMEKSSGSGYTRQEILEMLRKATYMGMQYECENWVLKRR